MAGFKKIEKINVKHHFTTEEMNELREIHVNQILELTKLEEEISEFKAARASKMKELTNGIDSRIVLIRNKYEYVEAEAELNPNFLTNEMEYVCTSTGAILKTRPLEPNENQLTLSSKK